MLILYIEDDIDDFDFFCEIVKDIDADIQCLNTRNGEEAVTFLENAIILPDMIFLDINMPVMDGKACLKAIRRDERLQDIPVVVYTTSKDIKDKDHCMQLGATEYLQKPFNVSEALQQLVKVFNR